MPTGRRRSQGVQVSAYSKVGCRVAIITGNKMKPRFHFSLRLLLLAVLPISLVFADVGYSLHRSRENATAIRNLERFTDLSVNYAVRPPLLFPFWNSDRFQVATSIYLDNAVPAPEFDKAIRRMPWLESVKLDRRIDNTYIQTADAHLESLARLKHLQDLSISEAPITDEGLRRFHEKGNDTIELISLGECYALTNDSLKDLKRFSKLQQLYLFALWIDDDAMAHLRDLPSIALIRIDYCEVSEEAVDELQAHYGDTASIVWRD